MKKLVLAMLIGMMILSAAACSGNGAGTVESSKPTASTSSTPAPGTDSGETVFITEKTLCQWSSDGDTTGAKEFAKKLSDDGYIGDDGIIDKNYNVKADGFRNITPEYMREHSPELQLFGDGNARFLMKGKNVYRVPEPTAPGACMTVWDYDHDGSKDIVYYYVSGSGILTQNLAVIDPDTFDTRYLYGQQYGDIGFDFDGENIYLGKKKVEWRSGFFYYEGGNEILSAMQFDNVCDAKEGYEAMKYFDMTLYENQRVVSGKSKWETFMQRVDENSPATILLGHYYDFETENIAEDAAEEVKDRYPVLYLTLLVHDANGFHYYTRSSTEEKLVSEGNFKYLVHCTGTITTPGNNGKTYEKYILSDDPDITWDLIEKAMYSSSSKDLDILERYYIVPMYMDLTD
ncbi:MAG: hypothetical protein IJS71_09335 [Clostridia bacterium]|nr:hypothetical protein [Clostridia bacterium]